MPLYDSGAIPLMERYKAASEAEGVAVNALLAYMKSGGTDNKRLMELTSEMTSANEKKMKIYQELQRFRLDK